MNRLTGPAVKILLSTLADPIGVTTAIAVSTHARMSRFPVPFMVGHALPRGPRRPNPHDRRQPAGHPANPGSGRPYNEDCSVRHCGFYASRPRSRQCRPRDRPNDHAKCRCVGPSWHRYRRRTATGDQNPVRRHGLSRPKRQSGPEGIAGACRAEGAGPWRAQPVGRRHGER